MCVVSAGFMSGRVVVQVSGVCGAHGAGFIMSSLCVPVLILSGMCHSTGLLSLPFIVLSVWCVSVS